MQKQTNRSKFRLKMACQEGEKLAANCGFDKFPVLVQQIVKDNEIDLVAKPSDVKGVSGGIIFIGNDVTIFYASNINNEGYKNFTIGHELGHYFLEGHPEEIAKTGGAHVSRAGFSEGSDSIELEADHFSSGLLMPTKLVKETIRSSQVGLDDILKLASESKCSLTASAIRLSECVDYPMAIVVSRNESVCYSFMSNAFKSFKPEIFLRKGTDLPFVGTREFNSDNNNIAQGRRQTYKTDFVDWFGGKINFMLDEEVVGLGKYGLTLTVLSCEEKSSYEPDDEIDEDEKLVESWKPKFAYGR